MNPLPDPCHNQLLAALPADDFARIVDHLELIFLRLGSVLYEPGGQLQHVYFPTTTIVSLHHVTESGAVAESASAGNEGVVGVSLFMGGNTTSSSAAVITQGHAYRLSAPLLKAEFQRAGFLQRLLLRYTQALITQVAQTAVCNRHHCVEQQLCRWLLMTLDRHPQRELVMTQELISHMLGVRRESVTEAARRLQQLDYIRYRRGHIAVLDRHGLESRVCECYAVVKNEFSRLLSDPRASSVG